MANVTITPTDNGPYLVKGAVKILDADGTHLTQRSNRPTESCTPQAVLNSIYRSRGMCGAVSGHASARTAPLTCAPTSMTRAAQMLENAGSGG